MDILKSGQQLICGTINYVGDIIGRILIWQFPSRLLSIELFQSRDPS